jgi:N-acetylneuraminic acid mutarotase
MTMRRTTVILLLVLVCIGSADAQDSCWTKKTDVPTNRIGSSAITVDGKIYVIGGGITSSGPAFNTLEVYDPATDTWDTTKTDMPTARANLATCVLNGKIYAMGGGRSFWWTPLVTVEVYDPVTDTWTSQPDMPRPRMGLTASVVDGRIYVIGGANRDEISYAAVDVFDPADPFNAWTTKADFPLPRFNLTAAALDGKIYAIGGHIGPPWDGLPAVHEYDPATDTWTAKADLITGRKYLASSTVNGKIYVFGGSPGHLGYYLSSVEEYDPETDTWTEKTNMPRSLVGNTASIGNERVYVFGGGKSADSWAGIVSPVYQYDPSLDGVATDVGPSEVLVPQEFALAQNYPNPFNPGTTIEFALPHAGFVTLKVYNVLGEEVATLAAGDHPAGTFEATWDANGLPSGVYFYQLNAGEHVQMRKALLMK